MTKRAESFELMPMFCGKKSFYGKAIVTKRHPSNGDISVTETTLYSYCENVVEVHSDVSCNIFAFGQYAGYSNTTRRHVTEFLKQWGVWDVIESLRTEGNEQFGIKPCKSYKGVFDTIGSIELGGGNKIYNIIRK